MTDFEFVAAPKQTVEPWYIRHAYTLRNALFLGCGVFWLLMFALFVGM